MKAEKKNSKKVPTARLTRDDWLDAAFNAVVEGGFDNVRVLTLADSLKVTRGSFYWHFADHASLVSALLARWRDREIELDSALQKGVTGNAQADLERLLEAALAYAGHNLEYMRFELALRGLGRRDPTVATMLVEVDGARMELFEAMFFRLTGDHATAGELAALFYLAIVGSNQALSRPSSTPRVMEYLKGVISKYLIRQQAPQVAAPRAGSAAQT